MSLLSGIIKGNSPDAAKKLGYLIAIVKELGWDSLMDTRTIKPNLRRTQLYIRKNSKEFSRLFGISDIVGKNDVVDVINPFLIEIWHIQIIGDTGAASLELLFRNNNFT
ncbi:Hypothetical protein HVR_LOCUS784 [uncultured virus]|nr:Hypothetical protein HVR_LOCUS784 [uncultured virus]